MLLPIYAAWFCGEAVKTIFLNPGSTRDTYHSLEVSAQTVAQLSRLTEDNIDINVVLKNFHQEHALIILRYHRNLLRLAVSGKT